MGQIAVGVLYGCEAPELPGDEDGEATRNLVDSWETSAKGPHVRVESEGGKTLLGLWVAVGGAGKDDAPYFLDACLPFAKVPVVFAKEIARAAKLWARFAAYVARKEGIVLPAPTLWLTPTETA